MPTARVHRDDFLEPRKVRKTVMLVKRVVVLLAVVLGAVLLTLPELSFVARVYHAQGLSSYNAGDYRQAQAAFRQELRLNPSSAKAYADLGLIQADKGDYAGALGLLNRAVRLDPHDAIAWRIRGYIHRELGRYRAALADYNASLRLNGSDVDALGG